MLRSENEQLRSLQYQEKQRKSDLEQRVRRQDEEILKTTAALMHALHGSSISPGATGSLGSEAGGQSESLFQMARDFMQVRRSMQDDHHVV